MPQPANNSAIQRPDLGSLVYEYMFTAEQRGFIGLQVMPVFNTGKQSSNYPIIPIESVLKVPDTKRAARGNYARGDWKFESGDYSCEEYGWEEPVDDVEAALYDDYFDAEEVSAEIATDILLRGQEQRIASTVMNPTNAIASNDVDNEWDKPADATPKADINGGIKAMRESSGLTPNAAIMSKTVFDNVMNTDEIRDYLQYTSPHLVQGEEAQRQTLARYFGVDRVLVGNAIKDAAKRGKDKSISDIWDDEYVALARISGGGKRLREPVFGRSFLWTEDSPQEIVTESYRDESIRSNIIRVRNNIDEAIIFKGALCLLGNITQ